MVRALDSRPGGHGFESRSFRCDNRKGYIGGWTCPEYSVAWACLVFSNLHYIQLYIVSNCILYPSVYYIHLYITSNWGEVKVIQAMSLLSPDGGIKYYEVTGSGVRASLRAAGETQLLSSRILEYAV